LASLIQVRRDTESNWSSNNPILASGEIAFSTDQYKIKIGDGVSNWSNLSYMTATPTEITNQINAALSNIIDSAPGTLDTLNELAAALNDDPDFFNTVATNLSNHESDTTNVHGIADTSLLATTSYVDTAESDAITSANSYSDSLATNYDPAGSASAAQSAAELYADGLATNYDPAGSASAVASDLSDHENATTDVHGISDTSLLATTSYVSDSYQPLNENLTLISDVSPSENSILYFEYGVFSSMPTTRFATSLLSSEDQDSAKTELGIGDVENIALSTWQGSENISSLGTIVSGTWNANTIDEIYISSSIARTGNETFTGNISLPSTTSIGDISSIEISYLDGVTSSIQDQIDNKVDSSVASSLYAPIDSPTFTTSVSLPTNTSIGSVTSTEISYLDGTTSAIQSQIDTKAPLNSPTFTGTVSGITSSMVGLGNVDNTSDLNKPISTAQQAALDGKASLSGDTFTGFITLHADPTQSLHAATKQYVDDISAGIKAKPSVEIATTSNLNATYNNGTNGVGATLTSTSNGAFPEIDGITLATTEFGQNGVLVKNQSNPEENGRYNLTQIGDANNPWIITRCGLCDESDEIPGMYVFIQSGTLYSGSGWVGVVSDQSTFTVGTDPINFIQFSGSGTITSGTNISVSGLQISTVNNPTFSGLITASSGVAFSDGTQTKVGVPSISSFVSKTSSYTLDDLTLRDNIIEVDSTSATTITIPTDASLNFPIGASIDVFQINTGEVTIAAAGGVTVNATPGLKLRTRWSSCTLLKRGANSWIVYGDLKA